MPERFVRRDSPPPSVARSFVADRPPALPHADARQWMQALYILRRRLWPALTVFLVTCALAAAYAFTRIPVYEARLRLVIEPDRANATGLSDPMAVAVPEDAELQTHLSLLHSRSLARRTLQALGRWSTPASQPHAPASASPISSGAAGREAQPSESSLESARIDAFLAPLRVRPVDTRSRLIDVSYMSADPVEAARVANAHAEQFIQEQLETRFLASKGVADWVSERLAEQRRALEESERALQAYREAHSLVDAGDRASVNAQQVAELTAAYAKAKADRIQQEALVRQVERLEPTPEALGSVPMILSSPLIQGLRTELSDLERQHTELSERLGPKHPTLLKAADAVRNARLRLQSELLKVSDSLQRQYAAARMTEANLARVLEAQTKTIHAREGTDVQFAVLEREAQSNRRIYESLLQRVNEFSVTRERPANNIRIVDRAEVPRVALGVNVRRDLRNGILGGLLLALCVAFLLDRVDNAVKSPSQILELHPSLLGMLPKVRKMCAGDVLIDATAPPRFSEAVRSLRTNLHLSIPAHEPHTVLVTSPTVGDGKSLVASNLAMALALGSARVLLIDADLRRPQLHMMFEVPQEPGLTTLLVEETPVLVLPRSTRVERLDVLPSGPLPPNPSELLGSARFKQVLDELLGAYDWIIVDSPPVMAVTDATVLGSVLHGVILVAAAEVTPLPLLRGSLRQIERAHAKILGIVLNQVRLSSRPDCYGEYYDRAHERYYGGVSVES